MKITNTDGGWLIRVPDQVVAMLGLVDGQRVTIRSVITQDDEIRHAIAEMRGNLPDYPFDHMNWNDA